MVVAGDLLSRADQAWLHAETPTNHFVVNSLAILKSPPDIARLKAMLSHRIELHPRLRQVVRPGALPVAPARWVRQNNFDLDAHVHTAALPAPGGRRQLADLIGDLAGRPLDFDRPLWQLYAIEGPGAGGALVMRFHHALGDGQAMVRMLMTLTDSTAEGWTRRPRVRPRRTHRPYGRSSFARALDSVPRPRQLIEGLGTVARLTLLDPDRNTAIRGDLSLLKAVAWTEPIPLRDAKQIAQTSVTSVNDVLVSAIAGGLGDYLRRRGTETRGMRLRAMMPVNLRSGDDEAMSGNRFSLVFLELPVGVQDPWERLMRVKLETDRIKASLEPAAGWVLVQGLGLLPPSVEQVASRFYAGKASLVLSNVIGPPRPFFIAGTRVEEMTFWEPESGGLGVGVSIFSYAGQVAIGVISDRNVVARPVEIADASLAAFHELRHVTD
jgi:diacylglycerol O-acyltransferase / wax synthase